MVNLGIIGVGYWGPNFARACFEIEGVRLKWVSDLNQEALNKIKQKYPTVQTTSKYREILKDQDLQAVIIVTPAQTHFSIAKDFLLSGKDVLIEKPLTTSYLDAVKLKRIVKREKRILMVDHIFMFNPGIKKLKDLIDSGELGKIYYISASYTALGPIRKDVDSLWDLAPHWIYTINYLLGKTPLAVWGKGGDYLKTGANDVVFINLEYPQKINVNFHISWLYPQKVRSIAIVGEKKMAVFDDVSPDAKLILYDKGASFCSKDPNFANLQVILRDGDIVLPKIENKEPLKESLKHFLDCIRERKNPIADVEKGLETVKILESIKKSLLKKNFPVRFTIK